MKLCRFKTRNQEVRVGLISDDTTLMDLTPAGITQVHPLLESAGLVPQLKRIAQMKLPRIALSDVTLCAPVEQQEVWAAGVTYLRSKTARMEESNFSAQAYDRVYEAARPELFFKSLPDKVVAPEGSIGVRADSRWTVPEPELALVLNSKGTLVGYTVGNDVSSRDIEGENLLYLPQAKIYRRSCALGPCIVVGVAEAEARTWNIHLTIRRRGAVAFDTQTSVGQIKRSFTELSEYLFRSQEFPHGAVLLTGTGIVPPDLFTLQADDVVEIRIDGIGLLRNTVSSV
jgi:2-dehydro-3-deoxy-D-arabinonate dehydratase